MNKILTNWVNKTSKKQKTIYQLNEFIYVLS